MPTATTLPFAGGELSSIEPQDSNCIESTHGGAYDPAFARCAIQSFLTGGWQTPTWSAASTFWYHCRPFATSTSIGGDFVQFYASGVLVMQATVAFVSASVVSWTFKTLQSGVLTTVGTFQWAPTLDFLDIQLVAGASGSCSVFMNGTQKFSTTGLNHTGFAGVTQVMNQGSQGATSWYCSEIICDTNSHIGDRVATFPIDTASAVNTGWTGSVGNIDEVVLNDSTFNFAASSSLISTYYANGFSLGTYNVVAVCVGARALAQVSGPQHIQLALRVGGSNYTASSTTLSVGYQGVAASWTTNPNTSGNWTAATAQGIEGGMNSVT